MVEEVENDEAVFWQLLLFLKRWKEKRWKEKKQRETDPEIVKRRGNKFFKTY